MAEKESGMAETEHKLTREYAQEQDLTDPLQRFRQEFEIPTKADLKSTKIARGK
jgi:hypothetical protein